MFILLLPVISENIFTKNFINSKLYEMLQKRVLYHNIYFNIVLHSVNSSQVFWYSV